MVIKTIRLLSIIAILLAACAWLSAEEPGDNGENELIQKRHEWFFSTRLAGANEPLRTLRWKGVLHTRNMMLLHPQGPGTWTSRGPSPSTFGGWTFGNVAGRIIALTKDATNNILYAGAASGGLWKSTDDGTTWSSIFDAAGSLSVGAIAIDPSNPQIIWAGTGENSEWCEEYFGIGLARSTDGGATWQLRNGAGGSSLQNLSAFGSIVVDPTDSNHLIVGGRYRDCVNGNFLWGGLYTSTDAGATWTNRLNAAGIDKIERDPANPSLLWAAVENMGLMKSTNGGDSWTLQTASGLPTGQVGRAEVAVAPSNSNYVYVLFASGGGSPQFWRSTNGGTSWTMMTSGGSACDGQCWYNMVLRVHQTNPDLVLRGTIHIFRSTNGGSSWLDLSGPWGSNQKVHQDTHEFLMDPGNPNNFYVGCDGGIWKSTDLGNTFSNRNGNLNITQFYAIGNHPTNDDMIMGGAQDNSSLVRSSSDVWQLQTVTGDGFVCHFNPSNPSIQYITSYPSGTPSVLRSTDNGASWFLITGTSNGINAGDRANWVTPYLMDPSNPNTLYLGTQRVYKSINTGSNWSAVGPADMTGGGSETVFSLEVSRASGSYVFAGTTDGKIWRTVNAGVIWTDISTGLPARSINDIAGDPATAARAFAAVGGFGTAHLYEHTGSGSWIARGAGLPNVPANTVYARTSSEIYVGTDVGIYVSVDGGMNFAPFTSGMPEGTVVTDLKYTDSTQTMTAGTYGRGAWQYTFSSSPCVYPDQSLTNGVALNDSMTCATSQAGWKYYSLNVVAGSSNLIADLNNLSANADLYVRFGAKPDLVNFDCRPMMSGTTSEQCSIPSPAAGTWWIGINNFDTGTINYTVQAAWTVPCPTITLSPATVPNGTVGAAYNQNISASGGTSPYSYSLTAGSLPPGILLSNSGSLSGTPTTTGTFNFTITATDSNSCTGSRNYSITINPAACNFPDSSLANGVPVNDSITCVTSQGGWKYYSFTTGAGDSNLVIDLSNLSGNADLYVSFGVKPDLANFDCRPFSGGPTAEQCSFPAPAAGTWWVGINNFDTGTINYTLQASWNSCLFCDDFEDGVLASNWTYPKGTWTEGSGFLNGVSTRKGIAIASPVFGGCTNCSVRAHMMTSGGNGNRLWLLAWYIDKGNTLELMMKDGSDKWILKQRKSGSVVSRAKATGTITPGVSYDVVINYDPAAPNFNVVVDGVTLITAPAAFTPSGTVGFQVKGTTGSFGDIMVN